MDAGVPFGSDLLDTSMPDNAQGYGEHAEVVAIQETLLDQLGRTWHGPAGMLSLPPDWQRWPETTAARDRLRSLISSEIRDGNLWAVKDPRSSRLLPLWIDLLTELGISLSTLVCVRHPDAVAGSLVLRNAMSPKHAFELWRTHHQDIRSAPSVGASFSHGAAGVESVSRSTAASMHSPPVYVDYDGLLNDPNSMFARVLEELSLPCTPEIVERATARIDPNLRHHCSRTAAWNEDRTRHWDQVTAALGDLESASLREAQDAALALYAQLGGENEAVHRNVRSRPDPGSAPPTLSVSVIVRTRDRTLFLPRAMRSILAQTYSRWHTVVINDGGNPGAVDSVLEPYRAALGDRLTRIDFPVSRGMEAASNEGIRSRTDDCVVIHDDDDSWAPEFLEATVGHLERSGAAGVVTASMWVDEITDSGQVVELGRTRFTPEFDAVNLQGICASNRFPPIAYVYRRALYDDVGPYREDLPVLGDWEFNVRALQRASIDFLPSALAHWHRRPTSDLHPNSDDNLHKKVEQKLRDEWARASGTVSLALGGWANDLSRDLARSEQKIGEQVGLRLEQHLNAMAGLEEAATERLGQVALRLEQHLTTAAGLVQASADRIDHEVALRLEQHLTTAASLGEASADKIGHEVALRLEHHLTAAASLGEAMAERIDREVALRLEQHLSASASLGEAVTKRVAHEFALQTEHRLAAFREEEAASRAAVMRNTVWGVVPTGRVHVAGDMPTGSQQSLGEDPQLIYRLPEVLPAGNYTVECRLSVPSSRGRVELFYSSTEHHTAEQSVELVAAPRDTFVGTFEAEDEVAHLRVDPMQAPGPFFGGALTIRRSAGAAPRLPDFLCIGAQRAGTTWLYEALSAHPGIYLPPCKELHALDDIAGIDRERWMAYRLQFLAGAQAAVSNDRSDRTSAGWRTLAWAGRFATTRHLDMDWYRSLFADAGSTQLSGDITPSYAVLPEQAVARAARAMPALKVVFMIRDPIYRALSGALHECTTAIGRRTTPDLETFVQALEDDRCISRSSYRTTIERWERYLQPGALHVFFFDDIAANPTELLDRVYSALGLSAIDSPSPQPGRVNENPVALDVPPALLCRLAVRFLDDIEWLAQRYGGPVKDWEKNARQLIENGRPEKIP